MNKKPNLFKDAAVLFAITILSGLLLGGIYTLTKEPIAQAEQAAKDKAYAEVLPEGKTFEETFQKAVENQKEVLADFDELSSLRIDGALCAKDDKGEVIGYVILATGTKSYGGDLSLAVGLTPDGIVQGTSILTINDTPGLGMKAKEDSFRQQYNGKDVEAYFVVKTGASQPYEIDAISSATITSRAYTVAVNGAKAFMWQARFYEEGGAHE